MSPADPFLHGTEVYVPIRSETLGFVYDALKTAARYTPLDSGVCEAIGRMRVYLPPGHPESMSITTKDAS